MRSLTALGTLIMMVSPFLPWIDAPIGKGITGWFGWTAILIALMGGVSWCYRSNRLLSICGITGLGLCGFFILHLAFMDPAFWVSVDENTQYAQIMDFSSNHLPANLGIEPGFKKNLFTEGIFNRLATASYFMGWGWWICIAGGLLLLFGCLRTGGRQAIQLTAISAIIIFAGHGIILFKGFTAQYLLEKGDRNIASGRCSEAILRYKAAQRLDPQLVWSERTYLRLGEAYYCLGIPSHPNALFYLGNRYAQQGNIGAAISEYLLALQDAPSPLREIVRKRIAWTYVNMGLTSYRKGNVGHASSLWEKALGLDPDQVQASYFLLKTHFDQGRYDEGIAMGRFLLSRSQNRLLNSNIQANIGDSYWKLKDFKNARIAYEASKRLDSYANFRIFKSLGGT